MEIKLSRGWVKIFSKKRDRYYYFNKEKNISQWENPLKEVFSVRHILIKHKESRRPSSWKQKKITRTKEEAFSIIEEIQKILLESKDKENTFVFISEKESDCNSAKRGGLLKDFSIGDLQESFEKAALNLKKGEVSDIVETDSGLHLIIRV